MCTIWIRETFCPKPKLSPRLEMCMCEVCTIESICNYLLFEWAVCTSTISPPFALDQTKTQNPKVGENHCENGNPVVNFLSLKKIFSPSRSIKENRLYSAMFNYADEKTQKVFQDRKEIKIEIWNTWKYIQEKYPCVNPHLHQLWPFFEHPVNNSLTFTKFTNIWQVKITCAPSWCFALQACLVLPCTKIAHHFILQISAQLPLPLDQNQSWDLDIVTAACPWPLFAENARLAVVTADEGLGDDHDDGDDDNDTDDSDDDALSTKQNRFSTK